MLDPETIPEALENEVRIHYELDNMHTNIALMGNNAYAHSHLEPTEHTQSTYYNVMEGGKKNGRTQRKSMQTTRKNYKN